mgnify:FL=1
MSHEGTFGIQHKMWKKTFIQKNTVPFNEIIEINYHFFHVQICYLPPTEDQNNATVNNLKYSIDQPMKHECKWSQSPIAEDAISSDRTSYLARYGVDECA